MLKKIGSILLLALIIGCSSAPPVTDYEAVVKSNEELKIDKPEFIPYTVTGLKSVECIGGICSMTESDFIQNQHDKRALWDIYNLNYKKDLIRIEGYNSLIDAQSHLETAIIKKQKEVEHLEHALKEERTYNAVKTWMERILFIGGAYIFSLL